jgi:hypothetical protein
VLIAAADVLPLLVQRIDADGRELLTFTDVDALRALDTIVTRRPSLVVLERLFAATPRGAALIKRIKADPSLTTSEIRVVSHDGDYSRVSRPAAPPAHAAAEPVAPIPASPAAVFPTLTRTANAHREVLDHSGTRRAARFTIAGDVYALVDGNQARLIDLSTLGAQVASVTILKPNQRVRVVLIDEGATIRLNAAVAWALFELPAGGARYRAGLEFVDPDAAAIDSFCARHATAP